MTTETNAAGTTAREAYDYLGAMREAYLLFDRRSVA